MMHLVVAYDVMDDRRRNRLAKFMMAYLDRVQKSVFEGALEEKRFEPMKMGIEERIDQDEDTVRIYELCARCVAAVRVIGTGEYIEEPEDDLIF